MRDSHTPNQLQALGVGQCQPPPQQSHHTPNQLQALVVVQCQPPPQQSHHTPNQLQARRYRVSGTPQQWQGLAAALTASGAGPFSYTNLTRPTNREVENSGGGSE